MTRLSHTASFHATNRKYCSTHSDNTKHTTCRACSYVFLWVTAWWRA